MAVWLQISTIGTRALVAAQTVMVLALCVTAAQAQIAIDNTSASSGDTATLSFPHTINSGSDALLMVGVEVHAQTKVTSVQWGTAPTICSATCDPASCLCTLTQVGTVTNSGKNVTVQLWALVNPPAGTGTIVIMLPAAHRLVSGATSFFGVDQTTPLGTAATNSADTGAPASVNVSSAAGEIVLDAVGVNPNATLTVAGTGQTQQYKASASSGGLSGVTGAGSTAPGAATVTMSWSLPPANWAIIAVSINPAPTPTGGPPSPTPSPTPTTSAPGCVGDCSDSGNVSVDALLTLASIALGDAAISTCMAGDVNDDMQITIDEILMAVNNALNGCPTS